jgi:hypothetical protein
MEGPSYQPGVLYLGLPETTYRHSPSLLQVLGEDTIRNDKGCEDEIIWLLNRELRGSSKSVIITNVINIMKFRPHCVHFLEAQEVVQFHRILLHYVSWRESEVSKVGRETLGS